ncbi:hypothetical protein FA13DRAFT_1747440 [Coprinellus micaceus]|uniref:Uncharacterized protein n=1 Tax=Coprinellus micaceus TaxID=71717 RepID=A0A4Y7S357_COPMI|nr:hypothetical protein FA13DRAFT_1747440 [Coprinellus micaceus]
MAEERAQENSDAQLLNKENDHVLATGQPQSSLLETLQLCFLRLVIVSSILTAGFTLYGVWAMPGTVLTALTTAHHIGTAFVPLTRLPTLIAWLDAILTVLEALCYLAVVAYLIHLSTTGVGGLGVEWFPKFALLSLVGVWILTLSILILLFLKAMQLKGAQGKTIRESEGPWWKHPAHTLFGGKDMGAKTAVSNHNANW